MSTKELLSKQPFYKQPIQKLRVKKLNNHKLLRELPFYDDINISRKERAFKKYPETYEVEIINNKSLSSTNLFDELLKKRINDNEHKFSTVYFNSLVKTVINQTYHLNESFEEILNLLDI